MHPGIDTLKGEFQSVEQLLKQPSSVDSTLRQLQEDRYYAEQQMKAVLEWVPRARATLDSIVTELTASLLQRDDRIAVLEKELADLRAVPEAEADDTDDDYPDGAISGRDQIIGKMPHPIRDHVNNSA